MRVLIGVGAVGAGVVTGVVGAFLQAVRLSLGGWTIPVGLGITLILFLVLVRAVIEATGVRWTGWLAFAGWLIATVVYAAELPSGSLVISAGGRQMTYLLGGVVIAAAAATIPPIGRLRGPQRLPTEPRAPEEASS